MTEAAEKNLEVLHTFENEPIIQFETDGIRGKAETIVACAARVGEAVPQALGVNVVVVGGDTRTSREDIEKELVKGLAGNVVIKVGILSTPGLAWVVKNLSNGTITIDGLGDKIKAAGIQATASHNPPEDNGLKVFLSSGDKPDDGAKDKLESLINDPVARTQGRRVNGDSRIISDKADELRRLYVDSLVGEVDENLLDGMKVVVDAGFGAAYQTAPEAFSRLDAAIIPIACEPNGAAINVEYGATHPEKTAEIVKTHAADFGVAFDGDADRVMMISQQGRVIDGDRMTLILALAALKRGDLTPPAVVGTIMSNEGLRVALQTAAEKVLGIKQPIELIRADVGDQYVVKEMKERGLVIGGEQSGHVNLRGETGDGVRTALHVMQGLKELGMTLDQAYDLMESYPQTLLKAEMPDKTARDQLPNSQAMREKVAAVEALIAERGIKGRVNVRASGTENVVRAMVELEPGHEVLARQLSQELVDHAHEQVWPKDIEELGEFTYGGERFRATTGRDPKLVGKILEMAREQYMQEMVPRDMAERFKNRQSFEVWYAKNRHLVALWDKDGDLAGIIWHGKSPITDEVAGLRRKGADIGFTIPEDAEDTFAIRIAEKHRKKAKVSEEGKSFARKFMNHAQSLYVADQAGKGRTVNRIWLETNMFKKQRGTNGVWVTTEEINDAVYLYQGAEYQIIGTYDNPDPKNPERRVMMVTGESLPYRQTIEQAAGRAALLGAGANQQN